MKIRIKIQGGLMFLALISAFFLRDFLVPQWKNRILEEFFDILGAVIFFYGFLIRITARGYKEDHTFSGHALVKDGLYAATRNPMYFGTFIIGTGAIIILFNIWAFFLFTVIFLFIYWPQIKIEENMLLARFGREYKEYCKKTPRLFPSIGNLLLTGRRISLKPFWIKKELSSFAASFIGISLIEIWEDSSFIESIEFVLIAVIIALFIMYKAQKGRTAKAALLLFFAAGIVIAGGLPAFAAQTPAQVEASERQLEKEKALRKKIETKQPAARIEQKPGRKPAPMPAGKKVIIKKIEATGVTLISQTAINAVVAPFENKELTVKDMQEMADRITDIYRGKGFITSRAYLPPQSIKEGKLEIRVIEGITGDIDVKGNRFFKSSLLKKKIPLTKGRPFNYDGLRKGLSKINQQEDRSAKAVLVPGKEPGATDIALEVKDRLPAHAGLAWDNFGSRYINKQRLTATVKHNNLLGFDDMLALQGQLANADGYLLENARYVFPVNKGLQIGLSALDSKMTLGKEFKDLNARGKTKLYSVYAAQDLINRENFSLSANAGFDYNDTFNFELEQETSRDRLRVAKIGLDSDATDKYGRTFISDELDFGMPNIMGGLKDKDSRASRAGSGGEFQRNILNLIRLQKMFFNSIVLLKGQLQTTLQNLPAPEQFQIGGIANVRGFGPAEAVGDRGYSFTVEWSFPTYFAKGVKAPFSKADFYDSLKWVVFYDRGYTCFKDAQPGEQKTQTLSSVGCGWRFSLPENFSFRFELAWALGADKPSDNYHVRPWCEVSKTF